MSFKIKANPTFGATLTITGQGREQQLKLVFRHKRKAEYAERLSDIVKGTAQPVDVVLELIESWEAEADLSRETLLELEEEQPGSVWAILNGYGDSLAVARKGN